MFARYLTVAFQRVDGATLRPDRVMFLWEQVGAPHGEVKVQLMTVCVTSLLHTGDSGTT